MQTGGVGGEGVKEIDRTENAAARDEQCALTYKDNTET